MFINQNVIQKIIQEEINAVLSEQENDDEQTEIAIEAGLEARGLNFSGDLRQKIVGYIMSLLNTAARP